MSNIDKQVLREEFRYMQDHYNDPADRKRQEIYIAAEALLDELEAAEKRIAELEARQVVLPRTQDVHPLGPQSAKIFCDFHRNIINRCADEIRKVGVNVSIKGE
ncbi:ead/Ea22-like family protein [Salmonella enterica subsp. enterica serovar Schwarzengrund]|uniref:ead/Ea22-like family protein n=1 Tax=Salmonella TaxID=590 RepID=UPI0008068043|nr:ead/Ea22-like family protein [Salmonella enterica]EAC1859441.1 hypothetical protein [Salmonella enterica subsp. enterica]EBH9625148.1 hypothetical protein [Salmonella enterica subsp. enterica serovar Lexington]EBL3747362.1 ead/Ea22-like family protein [Salmonella enterica subsp. enterica serovar Typhimurium]EBT6021893.1 ead/Ea22-like family protein [Salmonella enterica subsp. enterica serovar Thomasville]EBV7539472.1 hypothetical protein [Salmonella enterica subsp. enterica serovar Minnesot